MWIEKTELEELCENLKKVYDVIAIVEDNEKEKEIVVKLSTKKAVLEALLREVEPSPSSFVLKYEEKEDNRYKVEQYQFTSFSEEVKYNARLLHSRMFNLERELRRIMDSQVW